MSYEVLGRNDTYWSCHQGAWRHYPGVATAFGWVQEGALIKCDEGGYGEHPSGSYLDNDRQKVTDDDAQAMAAALELAIATINAGSPMTDGQAKALRTLETDHQNLLMEFERSQQQQAGLLTMRNEYLAEHLDGVRTVRTSNGTFDINIRQMMDLIDVARIGGLTIA